MRKRALYIGFVIMALLMPMVHDTAAAHGSRVVAAHRNGQVTTRYSIARRGSYWCYRDLHHCEFKGKKIVFNLDGTKGWVQVNCSWYLIGHHRYTEKWHCDFLSNRYVARLVMIGKFRNGGPGSKGGGQLIRNCPSVEKISNIQADQKVHTDQPFCAQGDVNHTFHAAKMIFQTWLIGRAQYKYTVHLYAPVAKKWILGPDERANWEYNFLGAYSVGGRDGPPDVQQHIHTYRQFIDPDCNGDGCGVGLP